MEILSYLVENSSWLGEQFSGLLQSEVMKMTVAFMIAARLHRGWVRKDMAEQFSKITDSIDKVAERVSTGLALHSIRIDELNSRVDNVEEQLKN